LIDGIRLSVTVHNACNDYYVDINETYTAINRSSSDTGAVLDTSIIFDATMTTSDDYWNQAFWG
jgi:hypothetical protein